MNYLLIAIAILVVGNYINKNWRKWYYRKDIVFPEPTTKRTDLYYGYYGCLDAQVAETRSHINLLHESQFQGEAKAIENILNAAVTCCLDVSAQVFDKGVVRADAESRMIAFFSALRDTGALKYIKIIYPIDEPNNTSTPDELQLGVAIIRRVAGCFIADEAYKLAVIYAADKPFMHQYLFDYVGFNDYDMKSSVLVGKKYNELKASLLSFQKTIIIPGGAYGQDPVPFVNYAQNNPEVGIVMPFLWLDDKGGSVGAPGIRSNGMALSYVAAGSSII